LSAVPSYTFSHCLHYLGMPGCGLIPEGLEPDSDVNFIQGLLHSRPFGGQYKPMRFAPDSGTLAGCQPGLGNAPAVG
jgi:hypothetical protein